MKPLSFLAKFFKRNKNNSEDFFDNNSDLDYEEAMLVIKQGFAEKFSSHFSYTQNQYYDPHGYWGITFSNQNSAIFLGSERSFIDYNLTVNGNSIYLGDFDGQVLKLERRSKRNFLFLMDVINKYLTQHPTE